MSPLGSSRSARFQFIGFPSEWGVPPGMYKCYPTTEFPIYWVPQRVGSLNASSAPTIHVVSNLLGSPASGELGTCSAIPAASFVSNLLGSPASGEGYKLQSFGAQEPEVSNLLGSPASGENEDYRPELMQVRSFQFIGFPSEWGDLWTNSKPLPF